MNSKMVDKGWITNRRPKPGVVVQLDIRTDAGVLSYGYWDKDVAPRGWWKYVTGRTIVDAAVYAWRPIVKNDYTEHSDIPNWEILECVWPEEEEVDEDIKPVVPSEPAKPEVEESYEK